MDRKFVKQIRRSFEKRGGRFGIAPDASPQAVRMLLEGLLDCPDCRTAVLEDVDIDAVIRDLASGEPAPSPATAEGGGAPLRSRGIIEDRLRFAVSRRSSSARRVAESFFATRARSFDEAQGRRSSAT